MLMTPAPLILASASPRRRELLSWVGLRPPVRPAGVDETLRDGEEPEAFVLRMAHEKAHGSRQRHPEEAGDAWVLAADTVVVLDDAILGKPTDRQDCARMLERLSGRVHEVFTGTCLLAPGGGEAASRCVRSDVEFRAVHADEVAPYLDVAAWSDKAGGYAVQGVAAMFIRAIRGSWTNVMGLPLSETVEDLRAAGAVGPLPVPPEPRAGEGADLE